jgi:hypothetical protein
MSLSTLVSWSDVIMPATLAEAGAVTLGCRLYTGILFPII